MDTTRLFERIDDFENALSRLQEALNHSPRDEFVRDAIIQRFEFTYEMAWKTMRLVLAAQNIHTNTPRETIQETLTTGLIADGNGWSEMIRQRNLTSHTYDSALAEAVVNFVASHAEPLLRALQQTLKKKVKR